MTRSTIGRSARGSDHAIGHHDRPLWEYVRPVRGLAAVRLGINFTRRFATARVGIRIEARMRELLYGAYLRFPRAFYDRHPTGQVVSRATNDLYPIRYFIGWGLVQGAQRVMMLIGAGIAYGKGGAVQDADEAVALADRLGLYPVTLPSGRPVWFQAHGNTVVPPFRPDVGNLRLTFIEDLDHSWTGTHEMFNGGNWDQWLPSKTTTTMAHLERRDLPFHSALVSADLQHLLRNRLDEVHIGAFGSKRFVVPDLPGEWNDGMRA